MTDIAREAGVSLSTVSYALSGKRPISEATRERVEAAIVRLDYRPSAAARALALQRTNTLGVAVPQRPDVDAHVILEFVGSFLSAAHDHDHDILLVTAEDHERTRRVVEEGKVDALIVMDLVEGDPRIRTLSTLRRPVVLIGYPSEPRGLSRVDFDFREGAKRAVRELHERGVRRPALLRPPQVAGVPVPTYAHRVDLGHREICEELGIGAEILEVAAEQDPVVTFVEENLGDQARFDGLVIHHEALLPILGRVCTTRGIQIPRDLQIVAISPNDVATFGPWSVSNVELPIARIGRTAIAIALEQLEEPDAPAQSRLIASVFHARMTTLG
jgi:DNA-binding LacI/PurR family transcriptional regulator